MECSRCYSLFEQVYEGQGWGCACYLDMQFYPAPAPPPPIEKSDEIAPFFVTHAEDAHRAGQIYAAYGSKHDMMTFEFVHPSVEQTPLTRAEIMERYDWVNSDTNVCDDCIDQLLANGELSVVGDPLGDMNAAFEEIN